MRLPYRKRHCNRPDEKDFINRMLDYTGVPPVFSKMAVIGAFHLHGNDLSLIAFSRLFALCFCYCFAIWFSMNLAVIFHFFPSLSFFFFQFLSSIQLDR